jgi:hypothetical protein
MSDRRLAIGLSGKNRLSPFCDPPGYPLAECNLRGLDLGCQGVAYNQWYQHLVFVIGLVDRDRVTVDDLAESVGDPVQERVGAMLGEDVFEDIRQPAIALCTGSVLRFLFPKQGVQ